jgi:hypothetical protein
MELHEIMGMQIVMRHVAKERFRQHSLWGRQDLPDGTGGQQDYIECRMYKKVCDMAHKFGMLTWRDILREEVFEALAEKDPVRLKTELLQVAAVAVAWVEKLDREAKATAKPSDQASRPSEPAGWPDECLHERTTDITPGPQEP